MFRRTTALLISKRGSSKSGGQQGRLMLPLVLVASSAFLMAQSPIPSLTRPYIQAIIGYGGEAAGAVACGLRTPEWGVVMHNKLVAVLTTHAGSPIPNFEPDGNIVIPTHVPSDAERQAALDALARHEEDGRQEALSAFAKSGDSASYCNITKEMGFPELDDYESDAVSLWPSFP